MYLYAQYYEYSKHIKIAITATTRGKNEKKITPLVSVWVDTGV